MSASTISKVSLAIAGVDMILATICAVAGDSHFAAFMILAGLMYLHGSFYRAKAEDEKGE